MQMSGQLKQWHKITLDFDGPNRTENSSTTFTNYRLDVTFKHAASGKEIAVPGYFAADGDAADSNAVGGDVWRAHFNPPEKGTWTWEASFRTGNNVAVKDNALAGTPVSSIDGSSGQFSVGGSNKTGDDLRAKGMLEYDGDQYLSFAGDGSIFLKSGVGSPENFLAYSGFDNTPDAHDYGPHISDRNPGDPRWDGGKGDGIIGAVNYLAENDVNSAYMLLMNVGGDGRDVWPWAATDLDDLPKRWGESNNLKADARTFDVSKLAQWEVVFSHMQEQGIVLHLFLQETENDQLLNSGNLGLERQLYLREMVARFGHHNGVIFNLGEENTNSIQQLREHSAYLQALDPYGHPIALHTYPDDYWKFERFEGSNTLDVLSFQTSSETAKPDVDRYLDGAIDAGRPVVAFLDEPGSAQIGMAAQGDPGWQANHANLRNVLWHSYAEGGSGVEWYFGYETAGRDGGDLAVEDFSLRESAYSWSAAAREFFEELPLGEMREYDRITTNTGDEVRAKVGEVYAIYLPDGGSVTLDLRGESGTYSVRWYDTIEGTFHTGAVAEVNGGATRSLGQAPYARSRDWALLVEREQAGDGGSSGSSGSNPVLELDPVGGRTTLPDDPDINLGNFLEKTVAVTFTTGGNTWQEQVIYEQGGSSRGLNLYIDDGNLFAAVWDVSQGGWGYKELETDIDANTRYVATLVMDGAWSANGNAKLFLDGQQVDSIGGVGRLETHKGDIGIGRIVDDTRLDNSLVPSGAVFAGTVEKLTLFNDALGGAALAQLNADMAQGGGATNGASTSFAPPASDDMFVFKLIDADTDEVIDANLANGVQGLTPEELAGRLAPVAMSDTINDTVKLELLRPDGTKDVSWEGSAPYAVFGDSGREFDGERLDPGSYDLTASANGITESVSFDLIA